MSVVVGESPTKLLPFHWIVPNALMLKAVSEDFLMKVLLFIVLGINGFSPMSDFFLGLLQFVCGPQRLAIRRMRVKTYIFVPQPAPRFAGLLSKFNSTHFKNLQYSICFIARVVCSFFYFIFKF